MLIVPCFNEAGNLQRFLSQARDEIMRIRNDINPRLQAQILFIDDGSEDETLCILRALCANDKSLHYIAFSRNFGKEAAIFAGLQYAKESDCGVCALLDADLQHPLGLLPQMYSEIFTNQLDCVYAVRKNREGEGFVKSALSKSFYKINNLLSSTKLVQNSTDYRCFNAKYLSALCACDEYHRFSKGLFEWVGFRNQAIEYENITRQDGVSSWSNTKLFSYALSAITSFSIAPLRFVALLGFVVSILGIIYAFYIVCMAVFYDTKVAGYPSIMCAIVVFGGLNLSALGIIGEYIGRSYEQSKRRPHFIIAESL
ncbi:glycosyltransferase family 2 protein [Helicobacter sp. 10-6591]|uniref:glycosyltransferase family 2 protein n=1 Tax=Helicobacter sp. 10-6591 TaxID=2004998 RepID=UPI003209EAC2